MARKRWRSELPITGEERVSSVVSRRSRRRSVPGIVPTADRPTGVPIGDALSVTDVSSRVVDRYRHGDTTHVSDLLYRCVRAIAIAHRTKTPMPSSLQSHTEGVCYAQGHAIQEYVTSVFMRRFGDANGDVALFGDWSCMCTYTTVYGSRMPDGVCERCGGRVNKYSGFRIVDEEIQLEGNADLALAHGSQQHLQMVECKSMARTAWEGLARPLADHVAQNGLYERIAHRIGLETVDALSFVYVSKDYVRGLPFRFFEVSAAEQEMRIDTYIALAKALADFKYTGGKLPGRICATDAVGVSKRCPFVVLCFSVEDAIG